MSREEVIKLILSQCEGPSRSESTQFGCYVNERHSVITEIKRQTGVSLRPQDVARRRVGKIADIVISKLNRPKM
jgi:hypothetical protein